MAAFNLASKMAAKLSFQSFLSSLIAGKCLRMCEVFTSATKALEQLER